jgi:hypothetical protein
LSGSVNSRGKWNVLKVFNGADKDRDGLLSALEWERLVVFKRGVVVSPDVAKRLFHELDPQESGAVDFDQFSNFLHNGVSNPRTAARDDQRGDSPTLSFLAGSNLDAYDLGKQGTAIRSGALAVRNAEEVALEREISKLNRKLTAKTNRKGKNRRDRRAEKSSASARRAYRGDSGRYSTRRASSGHQSTKPPPANHDIIVPPPPPPPTPASPPPTIPPPSNTERAANVHESSTRRLTVGNNAYLETNIDDLLSRVRKDAGVGESAALEAGGEAPPPAPAPDSVETGPNVPALVDLDVEQNEMAGLNERQIQLLRLTASPSKPLSQSVPSPSSAGKGAGHQSASSAELAYLRAQSAEKDNLLNQYQAEKKHLIERLRSDRLELLDLKTRVTNPVGYMPSQSAMVGFTTRNGNVVDSVRTSRELELALAGATLKIETLADEVRRLKLVEMDGDARIHVSVARYREIAQGELNGVRDTLALRDRELETARDELDKAVKQLQMAGLVPGSGSRRASAAGAQDSLSKGRASAYRTRGSYSEKYRQTKSYNSARTTRAETEPILPKRRQGAFDAAGNDELVAALENRKRSLGQKAAGENTVENTVVADSGLEAALVKRKASVKMLRSVPLPTHSESSDEEGSSDGHDALPPHPDSEGDEHHDGEKAPMVPPMPPALPEGSDSDTDKGSDDGWAEDDDQPGHPPPPNPPSLPSLPRDSEMVLPAPPLPPMLPEWEEDSGIPAPPRSVAPSLIPEEESSSPANKFPGKLKTILPPSMPPPDLTNSPAQQHFN